MMKLNNDEKLMSFGQARIFYFVYDEDDDDGI